MTSPRLTRSYRQLAASFIFMRLPDHHRGTESTEISLCPLCLCGDLKSLHLRDASRPDPLCAYSGCTLTTPNCRSSPSRMAAIIQRKLIAPPGAETLGW